MTTRQEYIQLLGTNCDAAWLEPKLDDADSNAVLSALADMAARLDRAQEADNQAITITGAPGGSPGNSFVTLISTAGPGGVLAAGATLFRDQRNWVYYLTTDVTIAAGASSTIVHVASRRLNNEVNTVDDPGMSFFGLCLVATAINPSATIILGLTSQHTFVVGDIVYVSGVLGNTAANGIRRVRAVPSNTQVTLETTAGASIPANGDFAGGGSIQPAPLQLIVSAATPVEGGWIDYLSMHGRERGQVRQEGESTESYRARVRNITDVVSPIALSEAILGAALSQGVSDILIREPFNLGETQALKDDLALGSFQGLFLDIGYMDNPHQYLLSRREVTAYFQVDVGPIAGQRQWGFFLDGTPSISTFLDAVAYFDGANNSAVQTAMDAIVQEIEHKRADGVQYDLVFNLWNVLQGSGSHTGAGVAVAFTMTPPVGVLWSVVEFMVGLSAPVPAGLAPPFRQHVVFTFEDATTFTTPQQTLSPNSAVNGIDNYPLWRLAQLAFPLGKRVTQIQGFSGSDGVVSLLQVLNLWVIETKI